MEGYGLESQMQAFEARLGGASGMINAFDDALVGMNRTLGVTGREVGSFSTGIASNLRKALEGLIFDGARLSDALKGLAQQMADTVLAMALKPVQGAAAGLVESGINSILGGALPFAMGGAFAQGRITPFARGGIVERPAGFPMRGGLGLMGEAGPEAIMPLARGADGRLGVAASGNSRPVTVVMNIHTPDVQGFQRSKGQIAAQAARALGRGQRNR